MPDSNLYPVLEFAETAIRVPIHCCPATVNSTSVIYLRGGGVPNPAKPARHRYSVFSAALPVFA